MVAAGIVEIFLGVEAAQKQLEDIAKPLTAEDAEAREAQGEEVATDDDLDLSNVKGEDAAPVEGGGRFEREPDHDRPMRTTGGES
jgi:hypothetical protein